MQIISISGRLTADCVKRLSASGSEFVTFTVAVNDYRASEKKDATFYYDCIMDVRPVTEYLVRGKAVNVVGSLTPSIYEKDGKGYLHLDVKVLHIELGAKPRDKGSEVEKAAPEDMPV